MDFLLSINWIALFALSIVGLLFVLIHALSKKLNRTILTLLALLFGAVIGIVFASENYTYLVWVELIGNIYVNVITALAAPIILVSIISSFVSLKSKDAVRSIGVRSVFWLLASAAGAIVLSLLAGSVFGLWKPSAIFDNITSVSDSTVQAYGDLKKSFDEVLLGLFPSNVVGDIANNNIVAIIIIAAVVALAYIGVASSEGEDKVVSFKNFVEATKKIFFKILRLVVDVTPYAVLCLIASSAAAIFSDIDTILQLLLLVGIIYAVAFFHAYVFNGLLIKFAAKLNPIKFFKKIFQAQATAFTTQSSIGTLPVTIDCLENGVGVNERIANFTAPLGTTIGMPGCTCVWPVLLVMFFVNAAGLDWGVSNYILLAAVTLVLSLGSAGVPGIAIVSSVAVFGALNLPIAAVVLLIPINTVSDMARTLNNATTAAVAAAIVARKEGQLDDEIFNKEEAKSWRTTKSAQR
ncbi:MAG: dicarboxylate/amino acid:cation symporter [Lachnospiraceae bacterium]|nr:dicarboxylate/amino acid:cation symporter [Ruminococcus sp.]MCM1275768.1 dicarboxylate/amino acid:cation symporter [Lachnospiraceae bacterium]